MSPLALHSTLPLNDGLSIPHIGLGTGGLRGQETTDAAAYALSIGYRLFDTSQHYGNEEQLGQAISTTPIPRSEIFIATKYKPPAMEPSSDPSVPTPRHSDEEIYDSIKASVSKLDPREGGYVDLMLLHHAGPDREGREAGWRGLARAQKEGLVKSIGVSNCNIKHLETLPAPRPSVVQLELNPFCQQRELTAYCASKGIICQAYCPTVRYIEDKIKNPIIVKIAERLGQSEGHVLLRWSLQKGFIPIPRSSKPARLQDNLRSFSFELSPEDMAALDTLNMGAAGRLTVIDPDNLPE
ncbi:hypothetical protein L202_03352 [Cryptococcus amylolentus CBS 6039]|uniref:NADP-dependent oxidoreductase domain-containing protein n=1 Tax=Cryptococcus amylolentus CBS 6039 TaxID=1295533 RepID=A0A1E3HSL2_9TREE|nr:hypothetical protein L202_03352 [Cryptococcus amylolentus CBS 6039]ODN79349.1 hypothetical protein L202_03352 [Cryptococcus amylolentus CBS 6039]